MYSDHEVHSRIGLTTRVNNRVDTGSLLVMCTMHPVPHETRTSWLKPGRKMLEALDT